MTNKIQPSAFDTYGVLPGRFNRSPAGVGRIAPGGFRARVAPLAQRLYNV
ncbi:MAG TPA: hypothetical protein VFY40_11500 [Blastocatellia bacterium]|nr:hypothetical protein [Blastocatellia bacterium]